MDSVFYAFDIKTFYARFSKAILLNSYTLFKIFCSE